jgi:hypothetical protein
MANTTYLQAVNSVLVRLREDAVGSVQQNSYATLIGQLVNDSLRAVQDAYDWNSLDTELTINTVAGQDVYTLTGFGERARIHNILDTTSGYELELKSKSFMDGRRFLGSQQNAAPLYYVMTGVDSNGDTKIAIYPTPDKAYSLRVDATVPQLPLSGDADPINTPAEPVILSAYARAIVERGEDASMQSSEAFLVANRSLSDAISIQGHQNEDYNGWVAV